MRYRKAKFPDAVARSLYHYLGGMWELPPGLLAQLRTAKLRDGRPRRRIVRLNPGDDPLVNLVAAVEESFPPLAPRAVLERDTRGLPRLAGRAGSTRARRFCWWSISLKNFSATRRAAVRTAFAPTGCGAGQGAERGEAIRTTRRT